MERGTSARLAGPPLGAELTVLKSMLEEQRAFRIDQLLQLHQPGTLGPLGGGDPEIVRSLITGARAALQDVQSALWRMAEGTYGQCVDCGDRIPVERLEILPQTARCLACQRPPDREAGA